MALTIFNTQDKDLHLLQTSWSSQLNPLLSFALNNGLLLKNVVLSTGSNTINHKLGRNLQGWFVTRMRNAFVQIYDTQDSNQMQDKTLTLNSSGSCTIDLIVF